MKSFKLVSFYHITQGECPEALQLAKDIDQKLDLLTKLVDDAIAREAAAGTRLPAVTTEGQFEQAMRWIDDSRHDPNSVGKFNLSLRQENSSFEYFRIKCLLKHSPVENEFSSPHLAYIYLSVLQKLRARSGVGAYLAPKRY